MKKRGVSEVVIAILLILLAIAAVLIVWQFVKPAIESAGEKIETNSFSVGMKIEQAYLNEGGTTVYAKITATGGDVDKIKILFRNDTGQTEVYTTLEGLKELETKTFTIPVNISNPTKVEIYPVFIQNGKEVLGNLADSAKIKIIAACVPDDNVCLNKECGNWENGTCGTVSCGTCPTIPPQNCNVNNGQCELICVPETKTLKLTAGNITEDGHIYFIGSYGRNNIEQTANIGYNSGSGFTFRAYVEFNTSSIPDTATINNVYFNVSTDVVSGIYPCGVFQIEKQVGSQTDTNLYADMGNGTQYNSSFNCNVTGWKNINLESSANTDLQNQLSSEWFAVGIKKVIENLMSVDYIRTSESVIDPELVVTYTIPC